MTTAANWNYPTTIHFGPGRAKELSSVCRELGMTRPLLVTDPGLARNSLLSDITSAAAADGLSVTVFSDIKANPTGGNVEAGTAVYREGAHDGMVVLGGGSAMDAGKAIALVARQDCSLWDLEDVGDNFRRAVPERIDPIVALPTTAGTGSEVGRASVITDEDAEVKRIIFHPRMLPGVVIADPELTVGLPAHLTAATGMDALSHNLEAFCAPGYHPMARGIAVEGIRLIKRWLPAAVENGQDLEARGQMLVASTMGATAFQRGLGAMHALAHPLGALFDAHHGTLNAILMPYVLKANWHAIESELDALARVLELPDGAAVMQWTLDLRAGLGIPHTLSEIGISDAEADRIGEMAVADPSAATNPLPLSAQQYRAIFLAAVTGTL